MSPATELTIPDAVRAELDCLEGPWVTEPDKIQWVDQATDLDCLMVRNRYGAWCGYVGVTQAHPWFELDYDAVDVEVHGGLTFADRCQPGLEEARGVCHRAEPGRAEDVWWLGFDCAHLDDLAPLLTPRIGLGHETYRDRHYVAAEVARLAQQIKKAGA